MSSDAFVNAKKLWNFEGEFIKAGKGLQKGKFLKQATTGGHVHQVGYDSSVENKPSKKQKG